MTNNEIMSEAEMLAEHEADKARAETARKAQEEVELAEREKKREEEAAASRAAWLAKVQPHLNALSVEAVKLKHVAHLDGFKLYIDNIDVSDVLTFDHMHRRVSSWRSEKTNQLRIVLGSYGDRRSFPQKKDGTFSYAEIAQFLCGYATRKIVENKAAVERQNNAAVAVQFREVVGGNQYYGPFKVCASSHPEKPLAVRVEFTATLSFDAADELYTTLKKLGYVK